MSAPSASTGTGQPWLVVIDMQHVFTDPASGWYAEGSGEAASVIATLLPRFAGRTVFTRFVRDPAEDGAWAAYYDRWTEFRLPPEHPRWELSLPAAADVPVVDAGRRVSVIDDACAGASRQAHDAALELMAANAPLVEVCSGAQVLKQVPAR